MYNTFKSRLETNSSTIERYKFIGKKWKRFKNKILVFLKIKSDFPSVIICLVFNTVRV